jgi:hypothetical protein
MNNEKIVDGEDFIKEVLKEVLSVFFYCFINKNRY